MYSLINNLTPQSGVGDLTDIKSDLLVGEGGRWITAVRPGWFYLQGKEFYQYVSPLITSYTASTGSSIVTNATSFYPTWGPVLVTNSSDSPYTEFSNNFYPGQILSWTNVASGLWSASIPGSALVVGVRDLTPIPLGQVAGSGNLISPKYYSLDYTTNTIYTKPNTLGFPQIYVDLLYPTPLLQMCELVVQGNGQLQASYQNIENLTVTRGPFSATVSGTINGPFNNPLPQMFDGDWAILTYYIRNSYCLTNDHTIQIWTTAASGDNLLIYNETSLPDLIPPINLTQNCTGLFNLNPLYQNAHRAGYLAGVSTTTAVSGFWTIGSISISLDKPEVCLDWGEPFKVSVLVLEKNGLPIPWYPFTLTCTANASSNVLIPQTTTDGRGEIHALISPGSLGTFTVSVVVGSVTGTATGSVLSASQMLQTSNYIGGQVNLITTSLKDSRGYFISYANTSFLDGIPKSTTNVQLVSKLAALFEYNGNLFSGGCSIATTVGLNRVNGITRFGFLPQNNDALAGFVLNPLGQSGVIK